MSWVPLGPRFVFAPRNTNFQRPSRRNEWGAQAVVTKIAIEPGMPGTIYVVIRPSTGGVGLYRSNYAGTPNEDWVSLVDPGQPNGLNGQVISPNCIAIDPVQPSTIYVGTWDDQSVYVSTDRGQRWTRGVNLGAGVRKLLIDPRTAGTNNTVIYAATNDGLFRSTDSGMSWHPLGLSGADIWSFCASMPVNGADAYYAGVFRKGLFTASHAAGPWTNLNAANLGLPAYNPTGPGGENFNVVHADLCALDPTRVYLVLLASVLDPTGQPTGLFSVGLYMSDDPMSAWSQVPIGGTTTPYAYDTDNGDFYSFYGVYDFDFAVAPNSPGKTAAPANQDILFFAGLYFCRSTDGGKTWSDGTNNAFHVDHHAFAFYPANAPASTIPTIYFGTDGGIAASTRFCDPSVDITAMPSLNELDVLDQSSGAVQNYNHGISAVAIRDYASHSAIGALQYIGANDTGIAAGLKNGKTGVWRGFVPMGTTGDVANVAVAPGPDGVKGWYITQGDPDFLTYMFTDHGDFSPSSQPVLTGTSQPVPGLWQLAVTPDNKCLVPMSGSYLGVSLVDQNAVANIISQDFSPHLVQGLCVGSGAQPSYCFTNDNRVWHTPSIPAASATTVWTQIATAQPPNAILSSIAIDVSNVAFVLAQPAVTVGGVTTPLFKVSGGTWETQACVNAPDIPPFGPLGLLADPVMANVLYVYVGGRVYRLSLASGTWNWQDISDDLPGQPIRTMWIGNIGSSTSPKVLLRVAIPSRGIWELDTSSPAGPLPITLYLRDNLLDEGLLPISPDGVPSPYAPTDPAQRAVHWGCADIKVDAQQQGAGAPFFQTDFEGSTTETSPISAIAFDCINDNSAHLPSLDVARVHVQVHNRSLVAATNVLVWAVYAPAAGHPPSLAKESPSPTDPPGNHFNFWSQFTVSSAGVAAITPNLPTGSPWQSIGPPIPLTGIDAAHPQVASWNWTVPLLSSGDPGHYCIVAFVHSADNRLVETSFDVDFITPRNRLIGQKNLHIGPPLAWRRGPAMREYIEFNNPSGEARTFDLLFDFRSLPKQLAVRLQFSEFRTSVPLQRVLRGIASASAGTLVSYTDASSGRLHRTQLPKFAETVYVAEPSTQVILRGVDIPAFGQVAAFLSIACEGALPPGAQYYFVIEQKGPGASVGGSTYVVRIARD